MYAVTAAQMRGIEQKYITELGIPSLLLMENAAVQAARHVYETAKPGSRIAVVCGPGNNGGDGYAIARQLFTRGLDVCAVAVASPVTPDAVTNLEILRRLGVPILPFLTQPYDVVVDALFGTGLAKTPEGVYAEAIQAINRFGGRVLSVDIPSGFCSDTGAMPGGAAVHAHTTVTFGFAKVGLYLYPCAAHCGEIFTEGISIPTAWPEEYSPWLKVNTEADIKALLPPRRAVSNKGDYGRVCVVAGCPAMPGAAVLACAAAYRTGAGLVDACVHEETARALHARLPEAVTSPRDRLAQSLEAADVILLGPGLGREACGREAVRLVMAQARRPLVIDADGLNILAADTGLLRALTVPCVITPHPAEMARLTGQRVENILRNPVKAARDFAAGHNVHVLLKGARTVIAAPGGNAYINATGSAALAKAGTGDVLAGIITGLAAQGLSVFDAAAAGAYLHGKAGEAAGEALSPYGVLAAEVADFLPRVFKSLV
jgi:NAD(P)H-hydrate epimerase